MRYKASKTKTKPKKALKPVAASKPKKKVGSRSAGPKLSSKNLKAKTLVQAWLEVELEVNGHTLAEALRELNKSLGSAHTHSRVREWEDRRGGRGDRLPRELRVYMAKKVIRHVLGSAGLSVTGIKPATLNRAVEQLS